MAKIFYDERQMCCFATVPDIVTLISKNFASLVIIANIIAVPLAYWGGQ